MADGGDNMPLPEGPGLAALVAGPVEPEGETDGDETEAPGLDTASAEALDAIQTGDPAAFRRSFGNFVRMIVDRELGER